MERQELNERIQHDYDEFKESTLQLTKEEIFEKGFEIDLKTFLTSYLTSDETPLKQSTIDHLASVDESILDTLCYIYLNSDTYFTYDDLCEEILEIFDSEFYEDETEATE
ncbi:MAG: hypothetical protein NC087_05230 [Anaeroplasma bactoclasticum]|nr:hypothetical protein [Anaeroplasma bactoclasticum]